MPGNRRGGGDCPTGYFSSAKPHNAGAAGVSGASRTDPHRTTGALAFLLYFFSFYLLRVCIALLGLHVQNSLPSE